MTTENVKIVTYQKTTTWNALFKIDFLLRKISKMILRLLKETLPQSAVDYLKHIKFSAHRKELNYKKYVEATSGLKGLEVGGPSGIFKTSIPVYKGCDSMEFANFSSTTIWEGQLSDCVNYYPARFGKQHICEATDLVFADNSFDFLLSSNCLEHVANPIKALFEWKRVASCFIILILPKKENNFDRYRKITEFEHLVRDYHVDTDETDLYHLDEILSMHDLTLDLPAGTLSDFKARSLENYENRCLHHHVFDYTLIKRICDFVGLNIIDASSNNRDWIFLIEVEH